MEWKGSIADELYSDVMDMPKTESGFIPKDVISDSRGGDGDDIWDDEDDDGGDMERQWQRRQQKFHRLGYREGLLAGKEAAAQEGFNLGFKESVFAGQSWGLARGVTSALSCLPDNLKEKLIETDEKRCRFQSLHESVRAVSTKDALELFYEGLNEASWEQGEATQTVSGRDFSSQTPDGYVLKDYAQQCEMLVRECSALSINGSSSKQGEATQTGWF